MRCTDARVCARVPFAVVVALAWHLWSVALALGVALAVLLSAPLTVALHAIAIAERWASASAPIGPATRVLITGAGAGIGREIALGCAARGAPLVLYDVDGAALSSTADAARALGSPTVDARVVDVSDAADVAASVASALEAGAIHVLISNAGVVGSAADVEAASGSAVARVFGVNVMGSVHLLRALMPSFRAARAGSVVLVSSSMSFVAAARLGPYCASKAALNALGAALRQELARDGLAACVSVAEVCPYAVSTGMFEGLFSSRSAASFLRALLFPRQLRPREVADAVVAAAAGGARGPVLMPARQVALLALLRALPVEPAEWLVGYMGGWRGMDGFVGKPAQVGGHGASRRMLVGELDGGGARVPSGGGAGGGASSGEVLRGALPPRPATAVAIAVGEDGCGHSTDAA